jgi:hypothetical protein
VDGERRHCSFRCSHDGELWSRRDVTRRPDVLDRRVLMRVDDNVAVAVASALELRTEVVCRALR